MKEKIKNFIWSFIDPDENEDECVFVKFTEDDTKKLEKYKQQGYTFDEDAIYKDDKCIETGLGAVLYLAELEFGVKFKWEDVGGFDSPGYDITCYAWACIVDGELYFDSACDERC